MTVQMKTARLAGALYLILIPLGFFWFMYVPSAIIVDGDMAATLDNVNASEFLFRLGISSGLAMNAVGIVLALVLYKLFRPVREYTAMAMLTLLLVGATCALMSEVGKAAALALSQSDAADVFSAEQLEYAVGMLFDLHLAGTNIASLFWGLWLFPLGFLVIKSGYMPVILGILLIIAGVGYVIDSFVYFLTPDFGFIFSDFTFWGEVTFTLWLLIKGVREEKLPQAVVA